MIQLLQAIWQETLAGLPDTDGTARVVVRLLAAMLFGGILGYERGNVGKAAGLRTHILVSLGAAIAVLTMQSLDGSTADMSRVIQGIVTGIGFIGGGVILKLNEEHQIVGVTTAATIWLTAGVGIAAGAGRFGLAVVGTLVALVVLAVFGRLERAFLPRPSNHQATVDDRKP